MENALLKEVTDGLAGRRDDWDRMADDLAPDVSYSMISKLGRGKYDSSPTIRKLELIAGWLRENPAPKPSRSKAAA